MEETYLTKEATLKILNDLKQPRDKSITPTQPPKLPDNASEIWFGKNIIHVEWKICSDGYYPYCSVCGQEPPGRQMTNYCPNCGAKMNKEK